MAVEVQPDGWRHWQDFERALEATGKNLFPSDAEALEEDHGRFVGLLRLTARRTGVTGENLYDPGLGVAVGVDRAEGTSSRRPAVLDKSQGSVGDRDPGQLRTPSK